MVAIHIPWAVLLFVPIVVLEGLVLSARLQAPLRTVLLPTTWANALSSLVGIPLTWGLLVVVEMVTAGASMYRLDTPSGRFQSAVMQAPWLLPHHDDFHWLIPTATLVLLPFYFLASVLLERMVLARTLSSTIRGRISAAAWLANAASYGILVMATLAWLWSSLKSH